MSQEHVRQLKVDIDTDLAVQVTVAAMTHGTTVGEEVSAALTQWLRPSPTTPERLATILRLEAREVREA